MTSDLRGPTESERRAIQQAVDDGNFSRAEALLAGIRRRLATSNSNKRASAQSRTEKPQAKKRRGNSKRKNVNEVRVVGAKRFALCPLCQREFSLNKDGRVRVHRDGSVEGKCRGSGVKIAKAWKNANQGNSIRTVSGGLPGLGKRQ